jgi:hypothetical protein
MAIENRFASEEYVLNQIENNNNTIPDWIENDSNSNNYIQNRTHYPKETITYTWDGETSDYEIYNYESVDSYVKLIRISNTINDSLKDLITNGVCKYTNDSVLYDSSNVTTNRPDEFRYRIYYNPPGEKTLSTSINYFGTEFLAITFIDNERIGSSALFDMDEVRVIFVL